MDPVRLACRLPFSNLEIDRLEVGHAVWVSRYALKSPSLKFLLSFSFKLSSQALSLIALRCASLLLQKYDKKQAYTARQFYHCAEGAQKFAESNPKALGPCVVLLQ